jgi:hypothetical protein
MEPTGITSLQERRKLNEEIEKAFIITADLTVSIQTYRQTQRGIAVIDLYERFYSSFSYLVILTSDLQQLRQSKDEVQKVIDWINIKGRYDRDIELTSRMDSGTELFMAYKKLLAEKGVIALPPK